MDEVCDERAKTANVRAKIHPCYKLQRKALLLLVITATKLLVLLSKRRDGRQTYVHSTNTNA